MNESERMEKRRRLGVALAAGGFAAWVVLVGIIVYLRTPAVWLLALAAASWVLIFVGKTLMKTGYAEIPFDAEEGHAPSHR